MIFDAKVYSSTKKTKNNKQNKTKTTKKQKKKHGESNMNHCYHIRALITLLATGKIFKKGKAEWSVFETAENDVIQSSQNLIE